MFFDKIQAEILKNAAKRDLSTRKGRFNYRYGYFNDKVVVTDNRCCALYLIPRDKFYLNLETVFRDLSTRKGRFNYRYGYFNDKVVVTDNRCCALYLIPRDKFYLNLETVFNKDEINFEWILKTECKATDLFFTNNIKQTGNLMANVLMNGDEVIYLDSKLLNTFKSKYRTLAYKGTTANSPVFIYEGNLMANVLMNGDEVIYLDSKLLNTFKSKYRTLAYKGTTANSPVFIYDAEDKTLLGLMLPVRIN